MTITLNYEAAFESANRTGVNYIQFCRALSEYLTIQSGQCEALRQSQSLPAGAVAGLVGKWRTETKGPKQESQQDIGYDACLLDCADELEQALQADAREKGEAWDGELFERAYGKGYRDALGAASSECRRIGEALDHAGNPYVRYADAIKCSVSISSLRPPEIANDLDKPVAWRAEFSDGWTEYADENGDGPDEWKGWANPPDRIIPLYSHTLATQPAQASEARVKPSASIASFPVDVLGGPMREFAPGKWESATWPSDALATSSQETASE